MRKGIIWLLVLAFLTVSIAPDSAFGYFEGGFGSGAHDQGGIVIAGLIIVGVIALTIASIARSKHKKDPIEYSEKQKEDIKISYEINLDDQRVAPSGDIVLVRW